MIQTNLIGVKHMSEIFKELLHPTEGRIVNTGSGSGPLYVANLNKDEANAEKVKFLCSNECTWDQIE